MGNMPLLQLFLLLLLAQSGFCLTRQNVSNKKCSEKHLEIFTNKSSGDLYHLIVKEKLTSVLALSGEYHLTDKDQMVEYQIELTGIEPITTASIQVNVNGCQQPVGWFDGLDPQWNTTQCTLDKHVFLQVVTTSNSQRKISVTWITSMSCDSTFRYRVDSNLEVLPYLRSARSAASTSPLGSAQSADHYNVILLANERFIHQLSLDGSRLRTIVSEPNQAIFTLDYHIRLGLLFWIDSASDKIMQSNLDGSQSMAILNQQSHTCLSGMAIDWISDKLYYHDRCHDRIRVMDLATNLHKTLTNYTAIYPYSQYYIDIVVDPNTKWLYWNSNRGIEKMSMDGKNRTVIINLNRHRYYVDTVLSLTLDYHAQMLYWIFYRKSNNSLEIQSSNVNGTNQQAILPLMNNTVNYYHALRFPPRLTVYNGTFFLSSPWSDEIYKLRASGDNFMTFINSLVFCRDNYYHLRVTEQLPVPNPCLIANGGCSHFCLLSAVNPRGYSCNCPEEMLLSNDLANCILQNITIVAVFSPSRTGSCMASGHHSCCLCQDNSSSCYCDHACHALGDCCSDVPLNCEPVPNPCLIGNGGCSHICLLSAVDPRLYSCSCPKGMILGDDSYSCINIAETLPLTQHGSCMANGYSSCCVNDSCRDSSLNCYCDANCHLFNDCCSDVPSDCQEKEYIMITNKNHIHRIDINETRSGYRLQTPVSGIKKTTSLDYHYRNNHLFWTDVFNDSVYIWRSDLGDGSEAIPIIDTGASPTQYIDIAVDWISDKIYWTNINRIMVYDLLRGYQTTVINSDESFSMFHQVMIDPIKRIIYWSDIASNLPRIKNASMDGSGVGTVVTLNSTGGNSFLFTIDYLQQMLYWMNSVDDNSNSCNYSKYIETSHTDGSGRRRIVYNASISTLVGNCTNNSYDNSHSQAIDFFGGAVYTYYSGGILQAVVVDTQTTLTYDSVKWYMCNSTNYTALKVISPKRQLQGINPCMVNNGGCAHLCLLSVNNSRNYTCACHSGTRLHQNGQDCIGENIIVITLATQGSCSAAGFSGCCMTEPCKGEPPNCYCDSLCHTFKDCCPDANKLCKINNMTMGLVTFSFITKPYNLSVNQSRRAEFQCSIRSILIPFFAWTFTRKGFTEAETIANISGPLSADYFIIAGHRSQVLIIADVQWRHEGIYTCIVSSDSHQIQAEASLNVSIPLTQSNMKIKGNSTTPERLDTVTIECNATAIPPANLTWKIRKTEGIRTLHTTSPRISITHQLTNAPNGPTSISTLTISNVEAADNGVYICEANNDPSSPSVSANFTICVIDETSTGSITITPHDLMITKASRVEVNCSVHVCPTLTPLFMWTFTQRGEQNMETLIINGTQSLSSEYASKSTGLRSHALIINNVQWKHTGVYKCIASIGSKQIEAQTSLDVLVPVNNMMIGGSSNSPKKQDSVTIECNVTANPPANIKWTKRISQRMQILSLATSPRISITSHNHHTDTTDGPTSRSTLTISDVEAADNGVYICEANNGPSSLSVSANFTICVIAQESVTVMPLNPWANASGRAELECSVCQTLMPLFSWNFTRRDEHNNLIVETIVNQSQPLSPQYTIRVGPNGQTLIIENSQWSDVGVYECIASIGDTEIKAETNLNVLIPLSNLSIRGDNDSPRELDTVTIKCAVTANPPANIIWFKRTSERWRALTGNSKISITNQLTNTENGPHSRSTLIVRNVEETDNGEYICEARNGQSSESESISFNFTVITQNECIIDNFGTSPCQNHGICIDHIYNYTCYCNGSYTGVNCSEKIPSNEIQPPMISQPPENTVTRLGDPIHLNCTAEGHPAPTYEWYKDGVLIPDETESVLYIPEPSPEDRGNYTCKAINSEGETDESKPAKLDIADVVQYQVKLNFSELIGAGMELIQIMELITTTVFPNSSASIFEVKQLSIDIMSSEEVTILVTVRRHDIDFELSAIHRQLRSALLQILRIQTVIISRFDGCNFTTTPFDIGSNVSTEIEWPETSLGDTASVPCPCAEFAGSLAGRAYRYCGGTFSQGAHWEEFDISLCEALSSMITRRLCVAALLLAQDPGEASEVAVEETSIPEDLTAAQVSISITIVANLTNEVLNNSELADISPKKIRQNYLQAIDNIQQAPAEVVLESQTQTSSSSRLLESLQEFLDKVEIQENANSTANSTKTTVFAFETFALQVQELDPEEYIGQIFNVNLGPLEKARKDNQTIQQSALVTSELESAEQDNEGIVNGFADSTASLQLPEDLLDMCSSMDSNVTSTVPQSSRLSYSVFKSDILFQNLNQSHLGIGSIIIAAQLKCDVTLNSSIKTTFQTDRMIEERSIESACAMWDKGDLEDTFGAWSTEGCKEVMKEGNKRVCECTQLAHFGILFDLSPKAPISIEAALALSIITYVGLVISLLCLVVFLISYLSTKELRTSIHGQILINLSLALMGVYTFFLIGGHVTSITILCGVSSALLHYFLLVFFGWTAVEAVWLYIKLVKVFGIQSIASKFTRKAGIPTWVVPLVVVIVCAGAASKYYINPFYCRATEWPFWIGMILPFSLVTIFNWIMFVLIMISICSHTQAPVASKKEGLNIKAMQTHFTIAATLAVVFGLGWALGLAATSLPVKELTLTFQILFSIFVGAQGVLLFLLHGVRNQDIRKTWIKCFTVIGRKSHIASVISSTKTSSAGQESLQATRNTSGLSSLPHKGDEYPSAIENAYDKQPYQSSMGGNVAMEMVPAGNSVWGQSEGDLQQVSYADSDEEHIYDDAW